MTHPVDRATKARRPSLTTKRVEGLIVIADGLESVLLDTLIARSDKRKVRDAIKWIRQVQAWYPHRKQRTEKGGDARCS